MKSVDELKHPHQPVGIDEEGTVRFKKNEIINYLIDNGNISLNDLARKGFSNEDWTQLAQLIGYSHSSWSTLSYVTNESYAIVHHQIEEGLDERDAKIKSLETQLESVKSAFRKLVPELFRIAEEDLID